MIKRLADLLTALRALVAFALVLLGFQGSRDSISLAMLLMMGSWVSDYLDGRLASLTAGKHSWLGDHDLFIDISAGAGLLIYLAGIRFIPLIWGSSYIVIWVFLFTRFGFSKTTGSSFQAPIYCYFLWLIAARSPQTLWWLAGWIAIIVIFDWSRFWHHVVPEYLNGLVATFWRRKSV